MERERIVNPVPDNIIDQGVVRFLRDAPPAHYSVKITSFSVLSNLGTEKYESSAFDACGFTWRLVLYPNGNEERGGGGHISLYLAIDKTDTLPLGWEVCVTIRMFVYDHKKDKYLTIQDDPVHEIRRLHPAKKECGFDRLISLETFKAARNGFLINDYCVFGVEVYDVKYTGLGEALKMVDDPQEVTFEWKVRDFSTIYEEQLQSEKFRGGKHKWCLILYPSGDSEGKGYISLYLELSESPSAVKRVLADFSLVIKNRLSKHHHLWTGGDTWFSSTESKDDVANSWGNSKLISLIDLKKEFSGFLLIDIIELEAKLTIKAEVTNFS